MKFGVLCNGAFLQKWQFESVKLLIEAGHECHLFVQNDTIYPHKTFFQKVKTIEWSHFIYQFWFRFMLKPEAKNMQSIEELSCEAKLIRCKTLKKGISEYFTDSDIELIRSYNLDFLLRYGFSILKGEILDVARYGIWSYHHDDEQKYRGVPTGFWEILFNDPVNAAVLQRLTSKIDNGVILHKAYFATINHSWEANLQNLLMQSIEWPLHVCKKIECNTISFDDNNVAPLTPIFKAPHNGVMLKFLFILFRNKLKFHFNDLFRFEKWQIGIIKQDVGKILTDKVVVCPDPIWITDTKANATYQADSFGYLNIDGLHLLSELYSYKSQKGIIVSQLIDVETNKLLRSKIALEKNYHLAFPFMFSFENKWYCLPENSRGNSIDLYSYSSENGELTFVQTLVDDTQAVDTVLFKYSAKWWLFFTDCKSTNERLNIWWSNSLFSEFKPHAANPAKTDIRSSRPAGSPFYFEGKWLRPAQDCSIRSGRRIVLNEIEVLNETEFQEKEFCIIEPPQKKNFKGMHTFHVLNGMILVDCKKETFVFQAFASKLKRKLQKLLT